MDVPQGILELEGGSNPINREICELRSYWERGLGKVKGWAFVRLDFTGAVDRNSEDRAFLSTANGLHLECCWQEKKWQHREVLTM